MSCQIIDSFQYYHFFQKILEQIIHNQLYDFQVSCNILANMDFDDIFMKKVRAL